MSEFIFNCPQCGSPITADDSMRGQTAQCPQCGKGIVIPRRKGLIKGRVAEHFGTAPASGDASRPHDPRPTPAESGSCLAARAAATSSSSTGQRSEADRVELAIQASSRAQKSVAWASFFREVVLFLSIGLIIAGATYFLWCHHREVREREERMDARHRVEEAERAEKLADERAYRKKQHEEYLSEKRADREREKAEKAEREKKRREEMVSERNRLDNIRRYENALRAFRSAFVDYWKNATKADRPGGGFVKEVYHVLVPTGEHGIDMFEIVSDPGKELHIKRLSADGQVDEVSHETFKEACKTENYFVRHGNKVFFSLANGDKEQERAYSVPGENDTFNASREEMGDLYDLVSTMDMRKPNFSYELFLLPKGKKIPIPMGVVSYGDEVPRDYFRRVLLATRVRELNRKAEALKTKNDKLLADAAEKDVRREESRRKGTLYRAYDPVRHIDGSWGDPARAHKGYVHTRVDPLPNAKRVTVSSTRVIPPPDYYGQYWNNWPRDCPRDFQHWEEWVKQEEENSRKGKGKDREFAKAVNAVQASNARFAKENSIDMNEIENVLHFAKVFFRRVDK